MVDSVALLLRNTLKWSAILGLGFFVQCWWPRQSMLWDSSSLSEFRTSLSTVLTLWHCVNVKQCYLTWTTDFVPISMVFGICYNKTELWTWWTMHKLNLNPKLFIFGPSLVWKYEKSFLHFVKPTMWVAFESQNVLFL